MTRSNPDNLRRIDRGLLAAALLLAGAAGAWQASTRLLRRRQSDPLDPPSNYGITFENVAFPARDGVTLRGWWLAPEQPNGQTLVIVPGHNGSIDGDTAQAARFAGAGYGVLLFNLRAHGGSEGGQVTLGAREVLDVLGALDWLQAERDITQVGLVGFSMGAGVALRVAVLDGRVRAVVADGTICRVVDGIVGLGRARGIAPALVWPAAKVILLVASVRARTLISRADPVRWADRVLRPVLFIHGTDDPFNTVEGAGRLAGLAPQGQLWLVEGAGHRDACRRDPEAYYQRVLHFLAETL
ncbi:MAG: alpha/beta fold hydrolase [Anaerolineae bacterium]|nr:alpha/beta fold hydrolase [Anaerolineae bacterium]